VAAVDVQGIALPTQGVPARDTTFSNDPAAVPPRAAVLGSGATNSPDRRWHRAALNLDGYITVTADGALT